MAEEGLTFKDELVQDDGAVFRGQVRNDKIRHGYGIQVWPDGKKYEGYWRNGERSGRGRLVYPEGDVYDGK